MKSRIIFTVCLVAFMFLSGCEGLQTVTDGFRDISDVITTGKKTAEDVKDVADAIPSTTDNE